MPTFLRAPSFVALLAGGSFLLASRTGSGSLRAASVPPPAWERLAAPGAREERAVFAGGCFWGIEAVFEHVKGVRLAVSGYAGGRVANPSYEDVSSGATGHAESVEVTFDPSQVTYGTLLRVFFSVAHDPTEVDRQGPDVGTQYRSAIFFVTSEQQRTAEAYIRELTAAKAFARPVVTQVAPLRAFYPAEAYHQHFATLHPDNPYIATFDLPKVAALQRAFPELYRP